MSTGGCHPSTPRVSVAPPFHPIRASQRDDDEHPTPSCSRHSESPPSYAPHAALAEAAASEFFLERPIAVPQERPFSGAPFFPAYAPVLQLHGITLETWHKFVAKMDVAVLSTSSVSDQALEHARSLSRRIRSASGGMWSTLVSLPPGNNSDNETTARTSSFVRAARTLREERIIATLAAANITWFHPQGLHVAMMDTAVLAGRLGDSRAKSLRGTLPSRLIEAARPRRDEGPGAQLAALRPWIATLEVDSSARDPSRILDLAPDSLWLVVQRHISEGEDPAGL
ncbi:hypothetical protein PG999_012392 [Apiospora kogelbergensis]|uniref:Uncharacterized protein n=1 Tax=Apiospora kogelbergensis TaxID=1337665 RepID=A0AAW0QFT6_9PEZI